MSVLEIRPGVALIRCHSVQRKVVIVNPAMSVRNRKG